MNSLLISKIIFRKFYFKDFFVLGNWIKSENKSFLLEIASPRNRFNMGRIYFQDRNEKFNENLLMFFENFSYTEINNSMKYLRSVFQD